MEIRELLIIAAKGEVKADPHLLRSALEVWRDARKKYGLPPIPRQLLRP
jgi:hypothetical protein